MRHLWRKTLGIVGLFALIGAGGVVHDIAPAAAAGVADIAELRDAVTEANETAGNDTIELVAGATYAISPDADECNDDIGFDDDLNETGDLDVVSQDENGPQDLVIEVASGAPAIIEVSCDDPEVDGDEQRAIEVLPGFRRDGIGTEQFPFDQLGTLTLRNVVITGGRAPHLLTPRIPFDLFNSFGGGVGAIESNVTLDNVTFSDNRAGSDTQLSETPLGDVSALQTDSDGGFGGGGGGLSVLIGEVQITDSTFDSNASGDGGDGLDGLCDAENKEVVPAGAGGRAGPGGAVFAFESVLSVDTSTFTNNQTGSGGAGGAGTPPECADPSSDPSEGLNGSAGSGGDGGLGGAIYTISLTETITHSLFSSNDTGDGGAGGNGATGGTVPVQPQGDPEAGVLQTPEDGAPGGTGGFGGNGGNGGAVFSISLAGLVDGLQVEPTPDRIYVNSTFDTNTTGAGAPGGSGGDGGIGVDGGADGPGGPGGNGGCGGLGGAVADRQLLDGDGDPCERNGVISPLLVQAAGFDASGFQAEQSAGALTLEHDTITENGGGGGAAGGAAGSGAGEAPDAGTDGLDQGGSIGVVDLEATAIVVGTSADDGADDCSTEALLAVSNFATDDSCGFGDGSVQAFSSFWLTALGDHGGPTATRVPQRGTQASPGLLINVVAAADCTVADDQRLFPRPTEGACEVGAVEVSALVALEVTKTPSAASVPAGSQVTFTITVKNTGTGTPRPGVVLVETNCSTPEALTGGDANSNGTLDPGETWTYTCTATPPTEGTFTNTVTATVTDTDALTVSAQATASVTVVAAAELARTGSNPWRTAQLGLSLILTGGLFMLRRPDGEHFYRRGWRRMRRGFRNARLR